MKLSTAVTYTQRLIAPKGFVFNLDSILKDNLFDLNEMQEQHKPRLKMSGRVLEWYEPWDMSSALDSAWWDEHLTKHLIPEENNS